MTLFGHRRQGLARGRLEGSRCSGGPPEGLTAGRRGPSSRAWRRCGCHQPGAPLASSLRLRATYGLRPPSCRTLCRLGPRVRSPRRRRCVCHQPGAPLASSLRLRATYGLRPPSCRTLCRLGPRVRSPRRRRCGCHLPGAPLASSLRLRATYGLRPPSCRTLCLAVEATPAVRVPTGRHCVARCRSERSEWSLGPKRRWGLHQLCVWMLKPRPRSESQRDGIA